MILERLPALIKVTLFEIKRSLEEKPVEIFAFSIHSFPLLYELVLLLMHENMANRDRYVMGQV